MRLFRRMLIAVALTAAPVACGDDDDAAPADAPPSEAGERWTEDEVAEAAAPNRVTPVYEVPTQLPEYTLAFLNPSMSHQFFAEWSAGMQAAADFYGVELIETDLEFRYDNAVSQVDTIAPRQPDVIGSQPWTLGFENAVRQAGSELLLLDNTASGVPSLGIPDARAGVLGAEELLRAVQDRQESEWAGRDLVFVGLDTPNCLPCRARVDAALARMRETIEIDDDHAAIVQNPSGQDYISVMTDVMTAHPDSVFAIISYGDDPVIEAIQALEAGGREGDGIGVMLGGAPTAQEALRSDTTGAFVGALDFNPFQEGWNWVEAAIALLEGEAWTPYQVSTFITRDNVDELYPEG